MCSYISFKLLILWNCCCDIIFKPFLNIIFIIAIEDCTISDTVDLTERIFCWIQRVLFFFFSGGGVCCWFCFCVWLFFCVLLGIGFFFFLPKRKKYTSLLSCYGCIHLNPDGACKATLSFCKDYLLPAWIPNKTSGA